MLVSSHEKQAQPENGIKPNSSHNERARESIKGKHIEAFTRHHLFQVTPVKGEPRFTSTTSFQLRSNITVTHSSLSVAD